MSKRQKNKYKGAIKAPAGSEPEKPKLGKSSGPHPVFSHRYITSGSYCLKRCSIEQFRHLADKLRMLSSLEWKQIDSSPRETNGYEMLPKAQLSETPKAPFDEDDALMVFRFGGAKGGRIVGAKREEKFFILFIDHNFTFYKH
jgi:hypothetical protein